MSSGFVIALAVIGGIAVPVALVALTILAPKTPKRVLWFIGDVAEFTLFLFVCVILLVVDLGPGFKELKLLPRHWSYLRRRRDISHEPS